MVGGFHYINKLRGDLPGRFFGKALARIRTLTDHPAAWRMRWYVAPAQPAAIPAYGGQIVEQVRVKPGSVLTAVQASSLTGSVQNLLVQLRFDFDGGRELFTAPINAAHLSPTGASGIRQTLLPEPVLVSGDGTVTILIWNNDSNPQQAQVVLKTVEPGANA